MEFGDPKKIGRKMLNFSFFVVFGEFLLVIIKAGGKTTFGIFVHFFSANLKFNDSFVGSDDGSMKRLITILFRKGDVIFDSFSEWGIEGVDESEDEIASRDVFNDDAESSKIIDFADVLVVFGEFFMEGVNGFDATRKLEIDLFFV